MLSVPSFREQKNIRTMISNNTKTHEVVVSQDEIDKSLRKSNSMIGRKLSTSQVRSKNDVDKIYREANLRNLRQS